MLACNHLSNFDPWPLGMPLWPKRWLRFMAKSELYWWPLDVCAQRAGAFPVRRGRADVEAIETAVRLAREGNVVVMFPEGTRRKKGLRQEAPGPARARARRGSRSRPACRSCRRPSPAPTGCSRLGPLRVAYGAPIEIDDLRGRRPARRGAGGDRAADGAHRRARGVAVSVAARSRRRLVRAPRLPRLPKSIRLNAVVGFTNMLVRLWQAEQPDAVLVGWDTLDGADLPARGVRAVPVGAGVRGLDPRAARDPAGRRERARLPRREGAGLRGRRLPRRRGAGRGRATCSSPPPTATPSSSRATA